MNHFFGDAITGPTGMQPHELVEFTQDQLDILSLVEDDPENPELVTQLIDDLVTEEIFDDAMEDQLALLRKHRINAPLTPDIYLMAALDVAGRLSWSIGEVSEADFVSVGSAIRERVAYHATTRIEALRNFSTNEQQVLRLTRDIFQITARTPRIDKPYKDAMRVFLSDFVAFKAIQGLMKDMAIKEHKERKVAPQLAAENDGLFASTRELQRYTVPSVYIRDNTPLPIQDWHAFDWEIIANMHLQEEGEEPINGARKKSLARFDGFNSTLLNKGVEVGTTEFSFAADGSKFFQLDYEGLVEGKPDQRNADARIDLYEDGHLYRVEGTSLRMFAEKIGHPIEYEILRARLLAMYSDLVLPAHVIDDSEEVDAADTIAGEAAKVTSRSFLGMVLARRRLVEADSEGIAEELEKEARHRKSPRQHPVGGFPRKLRKGQTASPQANDLCRKYLGRDLKPGETFVSPHIRGGRELEDGEMPIDTQHRGMTRFVGASVIRKVDK